MTSHQALRTDALALEAALRSAARDNRLARVTRLSAELTETLRATGLPAHQWMGWLHPEGAH